MSLVVKIERFRAVKSAEISLDGISVLSGVNGSGKSTVAALTYQLLSSAIGYENIVNQDVWLKYIMPMGRALFSACNSLAGLIDREIFSKLAVDLYPFYENSENIDVGKLYAAVDTFKKALLLVSSYDLPEKKQNQVARMRKTLDPIIGNEVYSLSLSDIGVVLDSHLKKIEEETLRAKADRKAGLFQKFWKSAYGHGNGINTNQLNIYEETVPILNIENDVVAIPDAVTNVLYIDSPMALGEVKSYRGHWKTLNNSLRHVTVNTEFDFTDGLSLGLLNGKSNWEKKENLEQFVYHRPDGKSFNLLECATGLKSFSILQMLYASGKLDDKSLLILDEPEAHLHPQWVVEYARLIVRLRKYLGVKFLIASHSPDFIRAIKHVSEYEFRDENERKVSFYLAVEDSSDSFVYQFEKLGLNIAPIFKVFNKSLEKIDLYSGEEYSEEEDDDGEIQSSEDR